MEHTSTLSSFHTSKTYQYANWFAREYFVYGRKFVNFNCKIDQLRCYEFKNIEKESWMHLSLRILSFAFVIIPVIGAIVLIAHELDWKKYQLTNEYQARHKEWDNIFLKDRCGHPDLNDYSTLLNACIKSDLNPAELRFKQIVLKQIFSNGNKIYYLEGRYDIETLKAKNIELKEVLHLCVNSNGEDFTTNSLVQSLDRDMKKYNTEKLMGNSTFYAIQPSDFRWYRSPMNYLSPLLSNPIYQFLKPIN